MQLHSFAAFLYIEITTLSAFKILLLNNYFANVRVNTVTYHPADFWVETRLRRCKAKIESHLRNLYFVCICIKSHVQDRGLSLIAVEFFACLYFVKIYNIGLSGFSCNYESDFWPYAVNSVN